jgi:phosphate-selective porin OprO/OprP
MNFAWSVVALVTIAVPAYAGVDGDDDEKKSAASDPLKRLEKVEEELRQLKAEKMLREAGIPDRMTLAEQDKKDAPKGEADFKVSFTDGFHLKTTDGNFDLHIGGRWLEEYRYVFNRHTDGTTAGIRTNTNTFYAREAFLSVDGTLFKDFGFKLNGDFSQNQTGSTTGATVSTGAIIEEAWVEWKTLKEFRLMFGSFKAPASFEITDSPRFAKLIQRSPMARFEPNFDTGIKAYGSFLDTMFTYELAVSNGRSHLANTGRDNNDDNDGKEYVGRITVAPFAGDKDSPFKYFRLGVYGTFAHVGESANINPTGWPGGINTNELNVNYFAFPGGFRFNGDRYRVGAEGTFTYGPAMVRGEFMTRNDELVQGASHSLLRTVGYYVEGSVLLTGEDEVPNGRVVPKHPFNPSEGSWGAFELVGRFGAVSMDRSVLEDLAADFTANSNRVSSITLGFWWWPIQNVRFGLNYIGENYYQGVQLSDGHHGSHVNGILFRAQVDF